MRLWLSRASRGGFYDARIRRLAAYRGACGGRFLCANESGREGKTGKRQASGHPLRAVLPLHAPLFGLRVFGRIDCIGLACLAASHALIDCLKGMVERRGANPLTVFCVDQALHLACCIAVAVGLFSAHPLLDVTSLCVALVGQPFEGSAFAVALMLLVMWKPAAVFMRLLLHGVRVGGERCEGCGGEDDDEGLRAGRWIGMLERTIIAVLVVHGQFAAIAFVLTAKSIARFKMLDDKEFAECYLVGTLASCVIALVVPPLLQGIAGWV